MPGLKYAYSDTPSSMPRITEALIGISTNIYAGDALGITTNATYSLSSVPALRKILAADKTAHYKEGTPVAGILGVAKYSASSNALGVVTGNPAATTFGGINYNFPSMANGIPAESVTGEQRIQLYEWSPSNIFLCKLDATSSTATQALRDTLAGLILTTTNGVTTYTIHTGAAAADQCLRIVECDESDPLYGSLGGRVFVAPLSAFNQVANAVVYSTQ